MHFELSKVLEVAAETALLEQRGDVDGNVIALEMHAGRRVEKAQRRARERQQRAALQPQHEDR